MPLQHAFWAASLVAAGWLLPIGMWRMLAYRSEQVDHTPGMRLVAVIALSLGVLAATCFVIMTVVIVS